VNAHSLPGIFGHLAVFSFKAVKDSRGELGFTAAAPLFDFAPEAIDHSLATTTVYCFIHARPFQYAFDLPSRHFRV
jgi:hypothetical protein